MAGSDLPVLPRWWWKVDPLHPPPVDAHTGYFVEPSLPAWQALVLRQTAPPNGPHAVALADLAARPCLVLLGEPGIGKTQQLVAETQRLRALGQTVQIRKCSAIQGSDDLRAQLNDALRPARQGTIVHLFLDALDEAIVSIARIADVLVDTLGGDLDALRCLRLRITCRSAALPPTLVKRLTEVYGEDGVDEFVLLPLRLEDVAMALLAARPALTAPQREPMLRGPLAPLLARPLTLRLLARSPTLGSATTAYEVFCDAMPTLLLDHERGTEDCSTLRRRQFLSRALAVASLLGGKPTVPVSTAWPPLPDALATEDFDSLQCPSEIVSLVQSAALFRESQFAHRSYAEHLAAEQLARHPDTNAVLDLLFLPDLPGSRVVPQLRGLASQLGARRRFFQPLLARDPLTLLEVDPHFVSDEDRPHLIDKVLSLREELIAVGGTLALSEHLASFTHGGFVKQLLGWVTRTNAHPRARLIAAKSIPTEYAAEAASHLAEVALDRTQPTAVRVAAARAVRDFNIPEATRALKGLLEQSEETDAHDSEDRDEMTGIALNALWPLSIDATTLFAVLRPPRNEDYYGEYESFFSIILPRQLTPDAVPVALRWHAANLALRTYWPPDDLVKAIVRCALDALNHPGITASLGDWFDALLAAHQRPGELLREALKTIAETERERLRWMLLDLLVPRCCRPPEGEAFWYYLEPLIEQGDALKLLDRADGSPDEDEARLWIELAVRTQHPLPGWDPAFAERFTLAYDVPDSLGRKALPSLWEPCWLDSDRVKDLRESIQRRRRRDHLRQEAEEKRTQTLEQYRSAACGGDLDAFWQWDGWVHSSVTPNGQISISHWKPIAGQPAWLALSPSEQQTLLAVAGDYLQRWPLSTDWLDGDSVPWSALAGRHALVLLAQADPSSLDALDAHVWRRWTPALLLPAWTSEEAPREVSNLLLQRAYAADGPQYRALAMKLLQREPGGSALAINLVRPVIGNDFVTLLDEFARAASIGEVAFSEVLHTITEHSPSRAESLACFILERDWDAPDAHAERGVRAAAWLLRNRPASVWPTLAPLFARRPDAGMKAVHHACERGESLRWCPAFASPSDFASFFVWGTQFLGPSDGHRDDEPALVTPPRSLRWTLEAVLQCLTVLGTAEALAALRQLRDQFPANASLTYAAARAHEHLLENTWRGRPPRELVTTFCPVPAPESA